jgi:hypothetical protein
VAAPSRRRKDQTMAAVTSLAHVVRARLRLAQARGALSAWARTPGTDNDVDRNALDDAGATLVVLADGTPAGSLPHRLALRGLAVYAHAAASAALLERGLDAYRRGGLGPRFAGSAADRGLAGLASLDDAERRMRAHAGVLEDTERVLGFLAHAGKAATDVWDYYRAAFDRAFADYLDAEADLCALDGYDAPQRGALERYRIASAAMDEAEGDAER